jgi:hypothetical protein
MLRAQLSDFHKAKLSCMLYVEMKKLKLSLGVMVMILVPPTHAQPVLRISALGMHVYVPIRPSYLDKLWSTLLRISCPRNCGVQGSDYRNDQPYTEICPFEMIDLSARHRDCSYQLFNSFCFLVNFTPIVNNFLSDLLPSLPNLSHIR